MEDSSRSCEGPLGRFISSRLNPILGRWLDVDPVKVNVVRYLKMMQIMLNVNYLGRRRLRSSPQDGSVGNQSRAAEGISSLPMDLIKRLILEFLWVPVDDDVTNDFWDMVVEEDDEDDDSGWGVKVTRTIRNRLNDAIITLVESVKPKKTMDMSSRGRESV